MWEGERIDLPSYPAIVAELGAHSVLNVGCGTGNWASMLAQRGFAVVGLDPAAASLDVARAKPGAQRVQWNPWRRDEPVGPRGRPGDHDRQRQQRVPHQQEWLTTLGGVHTALRPGGHLVFESVDPAGKLWLNWNCETIYVRRESRDARAFESWFEVTGVDGDLVSIRRTYVFADDWATLTSEGIPALPAAPGDRGFAHLSGLRAG